MKKYNPEKLKKTHVYPLIIILFIVVFIVGVALTLLVGAIANGLTWQEALPIAADYTAKAIQLTLDDPKGRDYGVNFEEAIPYLLKRMGK